jgi:hypothetical protein
MNSTQKRLAWTFGMRDAAGMDIPDFDSDEMFLEAVNAIVLAPLERIGEDPWARFTFFRPLLTVARTQGGSDSRNVQDADSFKVGH